MDTICIVLEIAQDLYIVLMRQPGVARELYKIPSKNKEGVCLIVTFLLTNQYNIMLNNEPLTPKIPCVFFTKLCSF
jgi:hypothetical protein